VAVGGAAVGDHLDRVVYELHLAGREPRLGRVDRRHECARSTSFSGPRFDGSALLTRATSTTPVSQICVGLVV